MNGLHTEYSNLTPYHINWLDGCGAKFRDFGLSFSKYASEYTLEQKFVTFDELGDKTFMEASSGQILDGCRHCPTGDAFCQGIAEILGIEYKSQTSSFWDHTPKQVAISKTETTINGMAIDLHLLSEDDRSKLDELKIGDATLQNGPDKYLHLNNGKIWAYGIQFIENLGLTITDSPTEFLEYVAQQTGKEYKVISQDDKCMKCGNSIGNTVFTVCDNCWDLGRKTEAAPTYSHKVYRILDSLDGIPLDKRIPLSEWIPPMNSNVEVIAIASQDLAYHGYYKHLQGDCITFHSFKLNGELILPLDGHWMRIV